MNVLRPSQEPSPRQHEHECGIELHATDGGLLVNKSLGLCAAFIGGGLAGYFLQIILAEPLTVEGKLLYEEPVDLALTPTYPAGYYVNSRIYIPEATPDMAGKRVIVYGAIDSIAEPETSAYPVVRNGVIKVGTETATSSGDQ